MGPCLVLNRISGVHPDEIAKSPRCGQRSTMETFNLLQYTRLRRHELVLVLRLRQPHELCPERFPAALLSLPLFLCPQHATAAIRRNRHASGRHACQTGIVVKPQLHTMKKKSIRVKRVQGLHSKGYSDKTGATKMRVQLGYNNKKGQRKRARRRTSGFRTSVGVSVCVFLLFLGGRHKNCYRHTWPRFRHEKKPYL